MDKLKDAYFAGLLDGEGLINIYPSGRNRNLRPAVRINMTSKATIEAIASYFGGSVLKKKVYGNSQSQYHWGVTYQRAIEVIKRVRPYLITKANLADKVLNTYKPKYNKTQILGDIP